MVGFLIRRFVKDGADVQAARMRCGAVCGAVGIGINVLLFLGKLLTGLLSGSIAVVADAFNNLSDAGASVVTLCGFRLGGRAPDRDHPFGHGRFEYISGLLVSVAIMLMAVELLRSGVEKIISPSPVESGTAVILTLIASIGLKLYMAFYNKKYGDMINSAAMRATALDSLGDCAATGAVLASIIIGRLTGAAIDGWAGAMVAVFIGWAGVRSFRETVGPLLGMAPDESLLRGIREIVSAHPETLGIHDIIVHDYGPGRRMISLHVEVDGSRGIFELHDAVDAMERELAEKLSCSAIIHMDPLDNRQTLTLRGELTKALREKVDENISVHDLRVVPHDGGSTLSFDTVVPPELADRADEIRDRVVRAAEETFPGCKAETVIDIG